MRGHTKHRHNLSHYFIACRSHLGLRIQFTPASKETGGIFEKIVAGVTGLEPATSCVTGRRSNQLSYTPGKGRENVAEVFSRSSGSAKKMIRTTDAKEVGVGNTAEETCRCPNRMTIFLPQLSSVNPQFSIFPSIHIGSRVGKSQEKIKKWRRGRDSNPRYPCE